jgi:hypothetical protein
VLSHAYSTGKLELSDILDYGVRAIERDRTPPGVMTADWESSLLTLPASRLCCDAIPGLTRTRTGTAGTAQIPSPRPSLSATPNSAAGRASYSRQTCSPSVLIVTVPIRSRRIERAWQSPPGSRPDPRSLADGTAPLPWATWTGSSTSRPSSASSRGPRASTLRGRSPPQEMHSGMHLSAAMQKLSRLDG